VQLGTKDNVGNTPLHVAALYGRGAIAQVLVDAGAPLDSENDSGETPLQIAVKKGHRRTPVYLKRGRAEIARLLVGAALLRDAAPLWDSTPLL
jgi:ankyrin repeat protein